MDDMPRYWFGPKQYGWGPRSALNWQGWTAYGIWLAVWIAGFPFMRSLQHPFKSLAYFFGMIVVLYGMCRWKGEP
ncbi:MAG: hypothetical protein WB646_07525 [Steroidobacteraceae bacterium]